MAPEVSATQISSNLTKNWTQIKYNFSKKKILNSIKRKKNQIPYPNIEN